MSDENEVPKWASESQEHLESIGPKLDGIKKEGQVEIKQGLEKVQKADELKIEVEYLSGLLEQPHDPTNWNDEIITMSGLWMLDRIRAIDERLDQITHDTYLGGAVSEHNHQHFMNSMSSSDNNAGTALYLGAGIERRFQALEPTYTPLLSVLEPKRLGSRYSLLQELKSLVSEFGDEFIEMLDGSEAALGRADPDSLSQAAHSMRDCFQQLLEKLAPSKVVESQLWFTPADGAPGGISRRSRLKYMLYGSGENANEESIQELDKLADIAKNSLDLCMARAHQHDPSLTKEEVLLAIDQSRHDLLYVLRVYKGARTE